MKQVKHRSHYLASCLPCKGAFLPLAMSLVEKGAAGFGYTRREADGLVLAIEELFSFYAQQANADSVIEVKLEDQGYRLLLTLTLRMANPDLRALNLTWKCSLDDEESLELLGPMLAARSVSSLRLDFGADDQVVLRLTRNRDYPQTAEVSLPPENLGGPLRLHDPSGNDLRHFAAMAVAAGAPFLPGFLTRPGMAADMLAAGHLHALLIEQGNWLRGGVLWRPLTGSCLELYGPYVLGGLDAEEQATTLLLDKAVARISRSNYRGLVRRQDTLAGYERFFDFLGELDLQRDNAIIRCTCYYRQLKEESSGTVYCIDPLASFLGEHYDRLCLPRQIRQAGDDPARLRDDSVLAVELEHGQSLAILRPLCAGKDMTANLSAHLAMLRREGIKNFQVELNTGRNEDTAFAAPLAETGFVPRLVIPDAGLGDLVIYALPGTEAST